MGQRGREIPSRWCAATDVLSPYLVMPENTSGPAGAAPVAMPAGSSAQQQQQPQPIQQQPQPIQQQPQPSQQQQQPIRQPSAASGSRPLASFRLPPFAPEEADLWLVQVDCAFDVAGIEDSDKKFKLLVASLPTSVAAQVRDVITLQSGNYVALSNALRQRLAQSRTSRLENLLRHQQLGDRTPSQLLRDMRSQLTSSGAPAGDNDLLRTLFLQRLPQSTRAALSLLSEATPLGELAEAADRFLEASRPTGTVAAVSAAVAGPPPLPTPAAGAETNNAPGLADAIQGLVAVINRLETTNRRLEEAVFDRRPRSATPGRESRASSASRTRRSRPADTGYCWYHRRFGAQARKCVEPCSWSESDAGNA